MSRLAKKPIQVPSGVDVNISDSLISLKGPKGQLQKLIYDRLEVLSDDGKIILKPRTLDRHTKAMWGTEHAHICNMVKGVSSGFEKILELEGIGYKVALKGSDLELNIGFNKPVLFKVPDGVTFKIEKNAIFISGIDKQLIGETAAQIRKLRPPEPYKGKGIRYKGEVIKKKAGKKAVAAG